ncbi:MAG: MBL fold metallo-hydrolase [Bacteroidales bacterium]|jgi:glyoxylase-like metal-dependent hydrolase (beta-lactamase superfamily II)
MPQLKIFPFNPLQVNAYLIYEPHGAGILIDPSCADQAEFDELKAFIDSNHIRLDYQLNTHGHFDHVFGVRWVRDAFHPKYLIHKGDDQFIRMAGTQARSFGFDYSGEVPQPDAELIDNQVITAGDISLRVIHVPGHSQACVAFYEAVTGWLFSGDTLFAGGIGRTDLPGGSTKQILRSIRERLLVLPDETMVFPGHGPSSTIKKERLTNPYL